MPDAAQELLIRVRADTQAALAGLDRVSSGLRAAVDQAQRAGASFNDLTTAQRALSTAFGQARTDDARAQFAALASEVATAQAAMLSAATGPAALEDQLDRAVRAVYATEASLEDLDSALRLADQAFRSAGTDDLRGQYAYLSAELGRIRGEMVTTAQAGLSAAPAFEELAEEARTLAVAAMGSSASLNDLAQAQRAADAALQAARTDEARAEFAALTTELKNARVAMLSTGDASRQVGGASSNAQQAMFALSNAMQDAAFAGGDFNLIVRYAGNNVSQFVEQLGYMARQARATNTTLRATLLASLVGSGGIIIGIQAAIAAATLLGPKLAEAFRKGADEARDLADAINEAKRAALEFDLGADTFTVEDPQVTVTLIERAEAERARLQAERASLEREASRLITQANQRAAGFFPVIPEAAERARTEIEGLNEQIQDYTADIEEARTALEAFYAQQRQGGRLQRDYGLEPDRPDPKRERRGRRERTLADVLKDLREARAATQALFALGVIGPAEAAEAAASNLRSALDDALSVSKGESTEAVRTLAEELIRTRNEALALQKEQDRLNEIKEQSILADQNLRQARLNFRLPVREVFESPKPPDWFAVLGVDGLRDAVDNGLIRTLRDAESVYDSLRAAFAAATTDEARAEIRALMERVGALALVMESGATAAERYALSLANLVGEAAGQGVYDLLFGPEMTEAQRQLREFEFGLDGEALRAQFAEGSIGAQEFRLRMELLREEQAAFAAQFDPLKRAADGFFDAMKRGIADMIADLVRATATALVLKYVLGPLLGVSTGGFGAILGGLLGISGGAGKNGAAGAAPAAVQARELATAQAQGGTIVFRPEVGEFRVSNGYLLASVRAALAEERRSGRGSGAL